MLDEASSETYSQRVFTKDSVVAHASFCAEILKYESLFCSVSKFITNSPPINNSQIKSVYKFMLLSEFSA